MWSFYFFLFQIRHKRYPHILETAFGMFSKFTVFRVLPFYIYYFYRPFLNYLFARMPKVDFFLILCKLIGKFHINIYHFLLMNT